MLKISEGEIRHGMDTLEIADACGLLEEVVEDCFEKSKQNIYYITKLVIVLNWLCWKYYKTDVELARWYNKTYHKIEEYILAYDWHKEKYKHFTKEEINFYARETD